VVTFFSLTRNRGLGGGRALGRFSGFFGEVQPGLRHFEKHKLPCVLWNVAGNFYALARVRPVPFNKPRAVHSVPRMSY